MTQILVPAPSPSSDRHRGVPLPWLTWLLGGFAALCLSAVVLAQVQRQGDDLLAEMHPEGCRPASLATISPGLWDTTSALDIAKAVETWQFHNLEVAGEPVEPVALCAGRRLSGSETSGLLVRRFTTPKQIYTAQLGWLSTLQLPLTAAAMMGSVIAARRRLPLTITVPVCALAIFAWFVERHELRVQLNRAWTEAVNGGLANPANLDVALLNRAAQVRFGGFALTALFIGLAIAPSLLTAARSAVAASRGIRLNLALIVLSATVILVVPQADDAVRRSGPGQMILSFGFTVILGLVFTTVCARKPVTLVVARSPLPAPTTQLRTLVPYTVTSLVLVVVGLASGARGLLVLAAVIGAVAAFSAPLDRHTTWDAARSPERPGDPTQPWLVGIIGAAPAAALGLVTIRVSATDELGISTAEAIPALLLGAAAVVGSAGLAVGFASFNRSVTAKEFSPAQWLRAAAAAASASVVVAVFADPTDLGVVVIFCVSMASLLLALTVLRAFGDTLLASRSWWRYAMPPALLSLGVRRSPFSLLIGIWIAALPLVGSLGYHDVVLASRGGSPFQPPAAQTLDEVASGWVARQDLVGGPRALPALTVASSGGGIRSAYWTAAVLDCIIDGETVGDDPCAGRTNPADAEHRRDSLAMLSGVSGGAVGMVSYIAQVDGGWQVQTGATRPRWYDQRFGADFQAAVFSEMLTGDAVEFFLRTGRGDDRARALERAFEAQWPDGELSRGFLTAQNSGEPFLFLHGFSAENGCRFNLSILDSNGLQPAGTCSAETTGPRPVLHGTTDLADFLCGDDDLRRSTVALLSARFPYVTPSGRLATQDCHRASADTNIVDGGYRSSSGSSAIAELWPALETEIQQDLNAKSPGSCLVPIHVQIDSSETVIADTTDPPNEGLLPLLAVARVANGVDVADRSATRSLFDTDRHFTIRPVAHPGDQAPLGWTLSRTSRADLQDQLRVNREAIETLRQLLDNPTGNPTGNPDKTLADRCQTNPSTSPGQVPNGG